MVNIISRARKLRELLHIRVGPGALILPKEVSKISMEFNRNINGGHRGARKFWREMLPRIKYRNPAIPIEINRHSDPTGPARLNIFFGKPPSQAPSQSQSSDSPPSATPNPRVTGVPDAQTPAHSVDIRMFPESEILAQLVSRTGAEELKPTEVEEAELVELAEFNARSEADRILVREKLTKERKEAAMLKLARGEIDAVA